MAQNLAEQLMRRLATDTAFREALRALDPAGRRVFLDANGFQGVSPEGIQAVAHTTFKALTAGQGGIAEADATDAITIDDTYAAPIHGVETIRAQTLATHGLATHWAQALATPGLATPGAATPVPEAALAH